jgi:hypothetical protein
MRTPNAGEIFEGIMGPEEHKAIAPEPEIIRDSRGRLYLAGPVLRRLPEPQPALSKRARAKIKRLAKKPLTPARAAVHARVGAFFA